MKEKSMVKNGVVLLGLLALLLMAVMALPVSSAKEVTFAHMTDVHLCETVFWKS